MLLNSKPLNSKIPCLNASNTIGFKANVVNSVPLITLLFKKAIYNSAVRVLYMLTTISYLYTLELNNSYNVYIYYILNIKLTFYFYFNAGTNVSASYTK